MGQIAVLVKVNNKSKVKAKLPKWTSENPDTIIKDVQSGKERKITDLNAVGCKKDLEENNAAVVNVV